MLPEIRSATDIHFGSFFPLLLPLRPRKLKLWKNGNTPGDIILLHMCTKNKDMECDRQNCLSFWAIFCPFTSKNDPENQNFGKMKNWTPEGIIILHMRSINDNHMMYGSWDMERNRQCFVVWANFCPFYPTNNLKNQNFEKLKKKLGDLELSYETQSRHDSSRHLNFFSFSIYHRATPQTQWTKQTVKKLNLWGKWLQTKKLG